MFYLFISLNKPLLTQLLFSLRNKTTKSSKYIVNLNFSLKAKVSIDSSKNLVDQALPASEALYQRNKYVA